MTDMVLQHDLASLTSGAAASALVSVTAGGAGNNAAVTGLAIDRYTVGVATAAVFDILFQAALGAANTLSIPAVRVDDSADGVTWAAFQPLNTATVTPPSGPIATGPTGGGTVNGMARFGIGLRMARRFVRFAFTPALSAANGDTASLMASVTFAGFDRLPPVPGSPA